MDKNDWSPSRRLELQFQRSLASAGRDIFKSIEDLTDPFEIMNMILSWTHNILFHRFAEAKAKALVASLVESSARTWRMAARENTDGRMIYNALRKELQGPIGAEINFQIARNTEIIKSLPQDIAKQVTKYIGEESIKGRRANAIANDMLSMFPDMTKDRAKLIARTETSKTSTALTQARSESIGINWYSWQTSHDIRVRSSHQHMSDVLVNFKNPPSPEKLIGTRNPPAPYNAGNIYNCRCFPAPVVNLDYITFPAKVYWNGDITMMTRSKFERIR